MVFAIQQGSNRCEIEMTLELKTLWFEDLKKLDPQTSTNCGYDRVSCINY